MIEASEGRKKEILIELKKLNKEAWKKMHEFHKTFFTKYRLLQKTALWKKAKALLIEYFTYDNILQCPICKNVINYQHCVIHHDKYVQEELFTPHYIKILHVNCHKRLHDFLNAKRKGGE